MGSYNSIDIGKFVACIGIIAIHANPVSASYHVADSVVAFMISLNVPFFFSVSSFLFFNKLKSSNEQNQLLWKFIKRISILYVVWLLVQTVLLPAKNQCIYTLQFPLKLLFSSTFSGSWFYAALIISTSIIFACRKNFGGGIFVGLMGYSVFCLGHIGVGFFSFLYEWYRLYLGEMFLSFPYALIWTALGFCLTSNKAISYVVWMFSILVILNVILYLSGAVSLHDKGLVSWTVRFAVVAFLCYVCCNFNARQNLPYKWMRNMSTLIFMIHFYFVYLLPDCGYLLGFLSLKFVYVACLTLLTACVILYVSKNKRFYFLRYLY